MHIGQRLDMSLDLFHERDEGRPETIDVIFRSLVGQFTPGCRTYRRQMSGETPAVAPERLFPQTTRNG